MEIKITTVVFIDIDKIIEDNHLDYNSSDEDISQAVDEYVSCLEDCEYYLIGQKETEKIEKEVRTKIGKQMTLFKED